MGEDFSLSKQYHVLKAAHEYKRLINYFGIASLVVFIEKRSIICMLCKIFRRAHPILSLRQHEFRRYIVVYLSQSIQI